MWAFRSWMTEKTLTKMTGYSNRQKCAILRPSEGAVPVVPLCRNHGMAKQGAGCVEA